VTRNKSERKAELLAKAEQMIDELLQWEEEVKEPSFATIEGEVMKLRRQMDEAMMAEVLHEQEVRKEQGTPVCESCGGKMEQKGRQQRKIGGWVGESKVQRRYYYCPKCRTGFFPSGSSTGD